MLVLRKQSSACAGVNTIGSFSLNEVFSSTPTAQQTLSRYRVTVKSAGDKTQVTVMAANGTDSAGETGERIVSRLVTELR